MLGAGGAARGALLPLAEQAPAALVIANRTLARAQELLTMLRMMRRTAFAAASTFADLQGPFDVIINATSASLHGKLPPLPAGLMHAETLAYDMMYVAQETPFCRYAREQGRKPATVWVCWWSRRRKHFICGARSDRKPRLCWLN
jgi:shikimate dehydrogenase